MEKSTNPASAPKSGNTRSKGSVCVAMVAKSMVFGTSGDAKVELLFRYAGTASMMKGENRIAPIPIGNSQYKPFFRVVPSVLGVRRIKNTVTNVMATKTTALSECVKNIEPIKRDVESRNGNLENRSFCKYK